MSRQPHNLNYIDEPGLLFGHRQATEDPRDGLFLFGPLDSLPKPHGISAAVIGTREGIRKFKSWVGQIHEPIHNERDTAGRPFFPGFEAIFRTPLLTDEIIEQEIEREELDKKLFHGDQHVRTYGTVDLYAERIIESTQNDDYRVDVWFVVIPDDVYKYCRPNSVVPEDLIVGKAVLSKAVAKNIVDKDSLFPQITEEATPYRWEVNFHHQLKARLLGKNITTQILRESSIAPHEHLNSFGQPIRDLEKIKAHVAWTLSTAAYYKAGGRPWKLSNVRGGVCYIGLVYKIDLRGSDERNACCAAQMFLDSGDGFVFKGAVGPWYSPKRGEFHLKRPQAKELISLALDSYKKSNGNPPKQLFIHARTSFNDEEWKGFEEAASDETQLTGITIKSVNHLKLYRTGVYPVLRGIAYFENDRSAYLWSKGYVPRMQTSLSLEVPNPLKIEMVDLNKARVNFKHYGQIPRSEDATRFEAYAQEFLSESASQFFEMEWKDVSLTNLIRDALARERVKEAERFSTEGKHRECIEQCALAEQSIAHSLSQKVIPPVDKELSARINHFGLEEPSEQAIKGRLQYVQAYLTAMRTLTLVSLFHMNISQYTKLQSILPRVDRYASGRVEFKHKRQGDYSGDEARFCIRCVVELALKVQHQMDAENR